MTVRLTLVAALVLFAPVPGCVHAPKPAQVSAAAVAVFPPYNQTGDPLLIAGQSLLEKYVLGTETYTVPDALAAVARGRLEQQGFAVVPPAQVDAAVSDAAPESASAAASIAAGHGIKGAILYIDIRRWEPDNHFQPRFIIASVDVRLVDVASGLILWAADHPSRPIKTPGAINFGQAYAIAAETLMIDLLAPLTPPQ